MDDLHRVNVKLLLADPTSLAPEEAHRIFGTWIPQTTDEVLVDVAGYTHVPRGPATVLVGHEAHYVLDDSDGRRGLVYARKQPLPGDLTERLRAVLLAALRACWRLEQEPSLEGRVHFRGDEVVITANDRLRAPNTDEGSAALLPAARAVLTALFGGLPFTVGREPDTRRRLALHARSGTPASTLELLRNLDPAGA
ncbi:MAG: hypothetical protein AB1505_10820 [Candidatus Latescibacterota bacterium]